ncbi:S9 family peptidase [Mangrovactinospora gilvigrisea]|uniref:S9 family peptidase n=1 Tax=Mangrovactinospora gilvigrisea TaxID=1428644 RepID=A0A1J7CCG6_9ACTN|nr:S9 family peptidase [Mangrovactinospora gilvigrisea]
MVFLRSRSGTDRSHVLWVHELDSGNEWAAGDPEALLGAAGEDLSPEERARRERAREGSAGVVGYAADAEQRTAAFALSGRLFTTDLQRPGGARELAVPGPVIDPRPSPDGARVAYAAGGALRVVDADGGGDRALAEPDGPEVVWGLAEFVAAEEMDRHRGHWWSPDGTRLLVARVDEAPVNRWWIADPANPGSRPAEVAYPAAGTPNADVTLWVVGLDGSRREVEWDRAAFPYLAVVRWQAAAPGGRPLLLVQSRDQREQRYLAVDPESGATEVLHEERDPTWFDLVPGVPAWTGDGRMVRVSDEGDRRHVTVDGVDVSGPGLHVRAVLDVGDRDVLFTASAAEGAESKEAIGEVHVHRAALSGGGGAARVSEGRGVHTAVRGGGNLVLLSSAPDRAGAAARVFREAEPEKPVAEIASLAEAPGIAARPSYGFAGARRLPAAVLLPTGYDEARDGLLPVLMDPYGGPHGQRVTAAQNPFLVSQWFADQGFAVVVADGRGTPGRSPSWEKSIAFAMAERSLQDQVDAVQALSERYPLDLARVGIRGWSYGGYLAALAVLRRPDVFRAAVAGAPVTDFRLYDTHYTERYLGLPEERPEVYRDHDLAEDAGGLERPLMLIHGMADDNVVVAHTLRLSSALLAAGRPHTVLPLSGVTHMTPQAQVAENLLLLQVDFLRRSLSS